MNKEEGLEVVSKTSGQSMQTDIPATILGKLGLGSKMLETFIQGISEVPSLKSFMKEISSLC